MSDAIVHVRVPGDIVARLDQRAEGEMRSRSNLAAFLIAQGLREPGPPFVALTADSTADPKGQS
jgi:predicted transcriptional regulator